MLQHMWREVEREKQLLAYAWCALHQEKREVEREKQLLADAWCALDQKQRGAREGKKANGCRREQERAKEGKKLDRTLYILVSAPLLFFLKWWDLFGDG
jgi:hypothetical protein